MTELLQLRLHATPAGLCLDARGRLDAMTCHRLARALTAILAHLPARRVVLALYRVDSIDATGVAALVAAYGQAQRQGVHLLVCGPPSHVRAAIDALGAGHLLIDAAHASLRHLPVRTGRRRRVRTRCACSRPPLRPSARTRPRY